MNVRGMTPSDLGSNPAVVEELQRTQHRSSIGTIRTQSMNQSLMRTNEESHSTNDRSRYDTGDSSVNQYGGANEDDCSGDTVSLSDSLTYGSPHSNTTRDPVARCGTPGPVLPSLVRISEKRRAVQETERELYEAMKQKQSLQGFLEESKATAVTLQQKVVIFLIYPPCLGVFRKSSHLRFRWTRNWPFYSSYRKILMS